MVPERRESDWDGAKFKVIEGKVWRDEFQTASLRSVLYIIMKKRGEGGINLVINWCLAVR